MSKKSANKDTDKEMPTGVAFMSDARVREFMESSAARGQARLNEAIQRIAKAAAEEICSVFEVKAPRGQSFMNGTVETIAIIIAEQIKYDGHARDKEKI